MSNIDIVLRDQDGENNSAVTTGLREVSAFPYKRFGSSPLIAPAIRRLTAIRSVMQNKRDVYEAEVGTENTDFVDELDYTELVTFIEQCCQYLSLFRTNPSESTLNSVKVTLNKIAKLLREFDIHSVEDLRVFVNTLQRILSSYHRSRDVTGYMVDLTGTFDRDNDESVILFDDYASACDLASQEGDENSRVYEVVANVVSRGEDKTSSKLEEGVWEIVSKDIFSLYQC